MQRANKRLKMEDGKGEWPIETLATKSKNKCRLAGTSNNNNKINLTSLLCDAIITLCALILMQSSNQHDQFKQKHQQHEEQTSRLQGTNKMLDRLQSGCNGDSNNIDRAHTLLMGETCTRTHTCHSKPIGASLFWPTGLHQMETEAAKLSSLFKPILFVQAKGLVGKLPGNPASCMEEPCNSDPKHVLYALKWALFVFILVILLPVIMYYLSRMFTWLDEWCHSGSSPDSAPKSGRVLKGKKSSSHKQQKSRANANSQGKSPAAKRNKLQNTKNNLALERKASLNNDSSNSDNSDNDDSDEQAAYATAKDNCDQNNQQLNGTRPVIRKTKKSNHNVNYLNSLNSNGLREHGMLIEFAKREAQDSRSRRQANETLNRDVENCREEQKYKRFEAASHNHEQHNETNSAINNNNNIHQLNASLLLDIGSSLYDTEANNSDNTGDSANNNELADMNSYDEYCAGQLRISSKRASKRQAKRLDRIESPHQNSNTGDIWNCDGNNLIAPGNALRRTTNASLQNQATPTAKVSSPRASHADESAVASATKRTNSKKGHNKSQLAHLNCTTNVQNDTMASDQEQTNDDLSDSHNYQLYHHHQKQQQQNSRHNNHSAHANQLVETTNANENYDSNNGQIGDLSSCKRLNRQSIGLGAPDGSGSGTPTSNRQQQQQQMQAQSMGIRKTRLYSQQLDNPGSQLRLIQLSNHQKSNKSSNNNAPNSPHQQNIKQLRSANLHRVHPTDSLRGATADFNYGLEQVKTVTRYEDDRSDDWLVSTPKQLGNNNGSRKFSLISPNGHRPNSNTNTNNNNYQRHARIPHQDQNNEQSIDRRDNCAHDQSSNLFFCDQRLDSASSRNLFLTANLELPEADGSQHRHSIDNSFVVNRQQQQQQQQQQPPPLESRQQSKQRKQNYNQRQHKHQQQQQQQQQQ